MYRNLKYILKFEILKHILLLIVFLFSFTGFSQYSVNIINDSVTTTFNKSMLLGTNTGLFYEESAYMNFKMLKYLHDINPGIIRMPGGSWSDEIYWNGNRVRISEESYIDKKVWDSTILRGENPIRVAFDTTRYKNGKWND